MANSDIDFNNTTEFGTVKILMLQGAKGEKGDDGTSGDYAGLTNKPQINGVELVGNKTSDDLALASATRLETVATGLETVIDKTPCFPDYSSNYRAFLRTVTPDALLIEESAPSDGWYTFSGYAYGSVESNEHAEVLINDRINGHMIQFVFSDDRNFSLPCLLPLREGEKIYVRNNTSKDIAVACICYPMV